MSPLYDCCCRGGNRRRLYECVRTSPPCDICQLISHRTPHQSSATPFPGPLEPSCPLATPRFTGSFLFSQMLFNFRSGIDSRLTGGVIAVTLLILALAPFPSLFTLPTFIPASLLLLFGYDIAVEWLIFSWPKISPLEYTLLVITLAAMMLKGL